MNKISLELLKRITKVIEVHNISDNEEFDYLKIASVSSIKYEEYANNPLYFIVYAREEENNDGWYVDPIDYRPLIKEKMEAHPKYTFVVDKTMLNDVDFGKYKVIVVDDLNETIDSLFVYFKNKSKAKTIAVTGSVGKTTCVGLIETVLKQKYKVMRIYSKRITPLLLKSYIINFIEDDIDYIVLENSIYYHDHVKILANILKPDIGVILNIQTAHLGIDKLKTIDDICKYKAAIFQYAKYGYVIKGDEYLDKLHIDNGTLKYDDEVILSNSDLNLVRVDMSKITCKDEKFDIDGQLLVKPFILTELSKKQYMVSYMIGKELGLTNIQIKNAFEGCCAAENRMHREIAFGKEIIFDGDITTFERMKELSNNMYENRYLVLRKIGCSEETLGLSRLKKLFTKYKKVYVFEDMDLLDEVKDGPNVEIVKDHSFMKDLDGTIIYHYSGYFRVWNKYKEENLNIYDREKYPIKKE